MVLTSTSVLKWDELYQMAPARIYVPQGKSQLSLAPP